MSLGPIDCDDQSGQRRPANPRRYHAQAQTTSEDLASEVLEGELLPPDSNRRYLTVPWVKEREVSRVEADVT